MATGSTPLPTTTIRFGPAPPRRRSSRASCSVSATIADARPSSFLRSRGPNSGIGSRCATRWRHSLIPGGTTITGETTSGTPALRRQWPTQWATSGPLENACSTSNARGLRFAGEPHHRVTAPLERRGGALHLQLEPATGKARGHPPDQPNAKRRPRHAP